MSQTNSAILEPPPKNRKGKFLTFALGREEYGLEILKVREIIGLMEITAVPHTPAYVRGVINLRGQVIAVVDLRSKFGMSPAASSEQSCIIVAETTRDGVKLNTGIVVDRVQEVLEIAGEQIEEPPRLGADGHCDFILGMGKVGGTVKILLDMDRILGVTEVVALSAAAHS